MKIAQRLHYKNWYSDAEFDKTLAFLTEHKSAVDEITLFTTSATDGHNDNIYTMEKLRRNAPVLKKRIQQFHDAGFENVGINVLITIGHIDERIEEATRLPFQKIVGYKGDESIGCNCPNNEEFLKYTEEKYQIYAGLGADFIWIDDDIKIFWNGVQFGCFCPECMQKFNEKNGFSYTRESLVAEMEKPENNTLRGLWVRDVCARITTLLSRIGDAIREVDKDTKLGFMTQRQSWSTYNGMDFPAWFEALGAEKGRPGEGCYFDDTPEMILKKAFSTAQQAYEYPETVTDVQYELEQFPYDTWQKSVRTAVAELALSVAQGMNGALLNNSNGEIGLVGQDRLYNSIAKERFGWEEWLKNSENAKNGGFYPAFSLKYDERRILDDGESFFKTHDEDEKNDVTRTYGLANMGVPITMQKENAWGVILSGNISEGYTDEELIEIFKGAVIISGDAVPKLEKRGFGKYIGVKWEGAGTVGLYEEAVSDEPVNSGMDILTRDVHPAFFGGGGDWFSKLSEDVRVVGRMIDSGVEDLGIATSLFENELGGRVCVLGYAPFHMQNSRERVSQLAAICSWITKDKQSARLVTPGKTAFFVREAKDKVFAAVMNMTLDTEDIVEVAVRGNRQGYLCTEKGRVPVCGKFDGEWTIFNVGPAEYMRVIMIVTE